MPRRSSLLAVILATLLAVACNNTPPSAWDGTLTVRVSDRTPKAITYEGTGGPDITDYRVDLYVTGEDTISATTGFTKADPDADGNSVFVIRGLINDDYTIVVNGYIKTGETGTDADYHLVASDTTTFRASYDPEGDQEVTMVLRTLAEGNADGVSIRVVVPEDFADPA